MVLMTKKTIIIASVITISLLGVGAGLFYFKPWEPTIPQFVFDNDKAPDWWGGKNNNSRANATKDYMGDTPVDKLDVAGMTILHGTGEGQSAADSCFFMYSYYDYLPESIEAKYADYSDRKSDSGDGAVVAVTATDTRSISTFEGDRSFELRRYNLTIPGQDMMNGYAIGFAELSGGHIRIEGVCKTTEDVEKALPVLTAVSLKR